MNGATPSGQGSDGLEILDTLADGRLVCRVCGAMVPDEGDYPRVHWDWHEAANGA